jgi:hypothetical protein
MLLAGTAPGEFDWLMSRDYRNANIVVYYKDHRGDTIRQAVARAAAFIDSMPPVEGVRLRLASGYMGVLAAVNEVVASSQVLNLVLLLVIMIVTCAATYQSLVAALILLVPLIVADLLVVAFMGLRGIGLNINTLPIASIGVGVGVDYGIYLLSRICEEYQISRDYAKAIPQAIRTTGKAIVFTATTMVGGVIFWYFLSDLRFQAEMGLLLALVMLISMFTAMMLIPAIVYALKPRFVGEVTLLVSERAQRVSAEEQGIAAGSA